MLRYVFLFLYRQPGKNALASSGFLLAACVLILLSSTTQTTVVQANQIISQSWRPTYDLVVLPPQAKLLPGQNVPPDFLQSYDSGISIQQYQQIQQIHGIEVAAPIAYIGYVALPATQVYFPHQHFSTGYYQLNWTISAFDGQQRLTEYQQSQVYYITPCYAAGIYNITPLDIELENTTIDPNSTCGSPSAVAPPVLGIKTPDPGTFLLAAIDPSAESQLVHLDASITTGRMLTKQDTIHQDIRASNIHFLNPNSDPNNPQIIPAEAIPVLIHQQLPSQVSMTARFTLLAQGTLPANVLRQRGGISYLTHLPRQQPFFQGSVPLVQDDPQRFANARLTWDGHEWNVLPQPSNADIMSTFNYALDFTSATVPVGLTYQPALAPGGEHAYTLVPNGVQGPEVAFRSLHPLHTIKKPWKDLVYTFDSIGQFTDNHLVAQFSNPLNWLPETTYTAPPILARYNAQGHSISPASLLPTTNTAGYVLQPPLALTTLAAAQQLRGDHCISAIRIRVTGVSNANQESWKHIQQVAGMITERTHLQVLVTLGSSPQPTLVYVPGIKKGQFGATQNIAPVGWVEERWIAIGASILYLAQLGSTRLLLLGTVLAVCLGYLLVSFNTLVTAQRREFAVLSALGWRPWQPVRLFLMQTLLLALGGGSIGIGIALLIAQFLEIAPIGPIVLWTLPAMVVLAFLSSLYPLWYIWRIQPAEILRIGSTTASTKGSRIGIRLWTWIPPIGAIVLRNLVRSRSRTMLTFGSLFLSAVLLVLMFSSILALQETLRSTLLGNFVLLQTAVPQFAGCVFALILTFLSIADLLLIQVRERQQEIALLQAIGWRVGLLQRQFVLEGITLTVISTLPGILLAQWILIMQHTIQHGIPAPLIALSAVFLMVCVSIVAAIPSMRSVSRIQIINAMRTG